MEGGKGSEEGREEEKGRKGGTERKEGGGGRKREAQRRRARQRGDWGMVAGERRQRHITLHTHTCYIILYYITLYQRGRGMVVGQRGDRDV